MSSSWKYKAQNALSQETRLPQIRNLVDAENRSKKMTTDPEVVENLFSVRGEMIMSTNVQASGKAAVASTNVGPTTVAIAGVGLIGYGLMFLVRNFTGFIELGLTPHHVGGTPSKSRPSARSYTTTSAICRWPFQASSSRSAWRLLPWLCLAFVEESVGHYGPHSSHP